MELGPPTTAPDGKNGKRPSGLAGDSVSVGTFYLFAVIILYAYLSWRNAKPLIYDKYTSWYPIISLFINIHFFQRTEYGYYYNKHNA